jgi:ABC-type bacteriocin/lantibiotic exporter with double-glycine peptidase domain
MVLLICGSCLAYPLPFLIKSALENHQEISMAVFILISALLLVFLRETIFILAQRYFERDKRLYLGQLQSRLFKHFQLHVFAFKKKDTGYILNQIIDDCNKTAGFLFNHLTAFVRDVATFTIVILSLLVLNWKLAVVAILPLLAFLYIAYLINPKTRELTKLAIDHLGKVTATMVESLKQADFFRLWLRDDKNIQRVDRAIGSYVASDLSRIRYIIMANYPLNLIFFGGHMLIIFIGILLINLGTMFYGSLVATLAMVDYLFSMAPRLISFNIELTTLKPSLDRMLEFSRTKFVLGTGKITEIKSFQIKVDSFSYDDGSGFVLKDINIVLKKGDLLWVKGPSGSGKTSLLKILLGIEQNNDNLIIINDNKNFKSLDIENYWSHFLYVPQGAVVFSGQISDNLFVDSLDQVDPFYVDFINDITQSSIEEFGRNLSGGQKQRISLLRALINQGGKVIIFDEPANFLDQARAEQFFSLLEKIRGENIILIISHSDIPAALPTKVLSLA